ncbi:MAG: undecaprenyl-phosphate galactose phosphotransferase WbaP [Treponema sp.]|nr:undecaprenyl-phosphate galactose phosphotransferase WbaP [Treponema sp.]
MELEEFKKSFKTRYKSTSSFFCGITLMGLDAFILLLCIGTGFFIVNAINNSWINFRSFVTYSRYLPLFLAVFYAANLYPGILLAPQEEIKRISLCSFFGLMGIAISINVEARDRWPISIALLLAWPFASIMLPVMREIFHMAFRNSKLNSVPVVVFSKGDAANIIVDRLITHKEYIYSPALIITSSPTHPETYNDVPIFNFNEEIFNLIKELNIKVAIISDYSEHLPLLQTTFRYLIKVPKQQIVTNLSLHMRDLGGILAFSSTNQLTKRRALLIKRLMDILLCLAALPIVLLVSIFIIIAIKIDSPGPIFYGHKRVGKNHREIKCWKFRSMGIDSDEKLKEILATDPVRAAEWEKDRKFTDDPRVTKVGKFLRKTSLDELPQLWNIMAGDMSFVGPRPVTQPELKKYGEYEDYVLSAQPGLSGMWQISGRSDTGYEERITLDTYYIQNWSIWLDLWIIIKTIWVVLKGKGAY